MLDRLIALEQDNEEPEVIPVEDEAKMFQHLTNIHFKMPLL